MARLAATAPPTAMPAPDVADPVDEVVRLAEEGDLAAATALFVKGIKAAEASDATIAAAFAISEQTTSSAAREAILRAIVEVGRASAETARASVQLALLLQERGDDEGRRAVLRSLTARSEPLMRSAGLLMLGGMAKVDDPASASRYFEAVIAIGHPEYVNTARLNSARLINEGTGRSLSARRFLRDAVADADAVRADPVSSAAAALGLGRFLVKDRKGADAQRAYRLAIEIGDEAVSREAAYELGKLLLAEGDADGARPLLRMVEPLLRRMAAGPINDRQLLDILHRG